MNGFRSALLLTIALLVVTVGTKPPATRAAAPDPQLDAADVSASSKCPGPIPKHKKKSRPAPIQAPPAPPQTDCAAAPPLSPPIVQPVVQPPPPMTPGPPPVEKSHHAYLPWIAALLEILGVALLAREVWWGHKMEALHRDFEYGSRMNYLYARQDYDGVYVLNRLEEAGDTPAVAQQVVQSLGPAAVKAAVTNMWVPFASRLANSAKRYKNQTEPAAMHRRRLWLITGSACLMIAAILHLLD